VITKNKEETESELEAKTKECIEYNKKILIVEQKMRRVETERLEMIGVSSTQSNIQ